MQIVGQFSVQINTLVNDMNFKWLAGGKSTYISYFLLILLSTYFGSTTFYKEIFVNVIDKDAYPPNYFDFINYVFGLGLSMFAIGMGATGVSSIQLLPKINDLTKQELNGDIQEHVVVSFITFLGFVIVLLVVLLQ